MGGCRDAGKHSAPATGEQVRRLLAEGVPACIHLPPGHGPRSARMNGYRHGEGMSPDLRVIVYPPDAEGGRRGRVYGEILRRAHGPGP
ncbi:hypothetical protein ACIQUQ_27955 [Streptomyces sp. NPDC101118]|uniref:hypothetical protein n=1 Tax=Streptomyces sp. NPDC101118 TaxID=3366109 RepID=UPI0037F25CB5